MRYFNSFKSISVALLGIFLLSSCENNWDKHYSSEPGQRSQLRLYEYIQSQPELSSFAAMLEATGYDSLLNQPLTFTVWAPTNSALADAENWDLAKKIETVKNHITRFAFPTSGIQSKTIFMLDKKFLVFEQTPTGYSLGGKSLILDASNIATANGILHQIDGYVPYLNNIWEYIGSAPGLDSLRVYLYTQTTYEFDEKASVEIGTNEFGQAVYDSVISFKNPILDKVGHIHIEDSVFTALLPDNKAWAQAYQQIKNGYKTQVKDGGAAQQMIHTQWALVQNLFFKNLIEEPAIATKITSTTGSAFTQPAYLFENSTKTTLSNGLIYLTDSLRFKAADSWQKPIIVQAENSDWGRSYKYANLYVRSALGSDLSDSISDGKYLVVEPTTVSNSTQNEISIPIPNVLSGKYKIYAVFVPSSVVNASDQRPYKVSFFLSYTNASGQVVAESAVGAKNALLGAGKTAKVYTTNEGLITKMFVTEIEFPFCNLIADKSESAYITTKLKIQNQTKITETVKFDKTLRIDYIIFEPVQ